MPVTAEDIAVYLDTQDDFDLELFVHRSLAMSGFRSEHAGTYSDPVTGRPRRFDVRARRFFPRSRRQILLAVECQSLSAQSPLLVSRVPRSVQEGYHEVVRSWHAQDTGEALVEVLRWERGLELYPENVQVGKRIVQLRRDTGAAGGFTTAADEAHLGWSRAIASAADLVREADRACAESGTPDCYTLVLPVLVVSDEALWAADYTETGQRARSALPVQEVEIYVGREYSLRPGYTYRISHLHLFSRRGFAHFVSQLTAAGSALLEQMFQFTTRREKVRSSERPSAHSARPPGGESTPRADIAPAASKLPSP
jgi:hypothetical protein